MNEANDESHNFLSATNKFNHVRQSQTPDASLFFRKRYFVGFWTCIGFMLLFIFRTNLSIAIVDLTSEKNFTTANGSVIQRPEFDWDSRQKGFILSLFSYGCFFTPVGGILGVKYGGVRIFGLGIFLTALLNLFTPYLLRMNFFFFAIARVLEGVSESLSDASFLNIFLRWAPPHEKTRLVVFGFAGAYAGTFINYILCGFLAQNYGVDSIFYVTGGIGVFWYAVWVLFVSNEPSTDRFISSKERNYLDSFAPKTNNIPHRFTNYPWRKIFTSKPVWAVFNEYFCFSWLTSFILFCLPLYIQDTFNVSVESVGFISGAPSLGNCIGVIVSAIIADYLRRHRILPIPTIHKLYAAIGQLTSALFLMVISWWADFSQSIILFTIMRTLSGSAEVAYHLVLLDMFAEYTSIIKGLANCFLNLALLLNPTVMGFMVQDHSRSSWNLYFSFLSLFNIFSMVIFYFYGSGELQEWAAPKKSKTIHTGEIPIQMN